VKLKQLYRFVEGPLVWTYTSSDVQETYGGETYTPVPIGRDEAEVKNELSRANLEVKLPLSDPLAIRNIRTVVESQVSLTVRSIDPDDGSVDVEWKGRLAQVKPDVDSISLVFESIFTSLRRPGLRKRYQRSCPYMLYGRGCGLNKDAFAANGEVTYVDGVIVKCAAAALQPNGYYSGGMIAAPDGTLRFILAHTGDTLSLIRPLDSLTDAFAARGYGNSYGNSYGKVTATIYPGCDRTKETCHDKFNNLPNNGSFPWIPLKNPVGGSSIV
jgi:uncharacterized phage protein (TIGR02218 family)